MVDVECRDSFSVKGKCYNNSSAVRIRSCFFRYGHANPSEVDWAVSGQNEFVDTNTFVRSPFNCRTICLSPELKHV